MKKVLSFVLVLTLVLGSFSMVFAAVPTDVAGTDWETAVSALSELGVVNGYTDGTYKPSNSVNRAEAAKLVIAALGLTAYAENYTGSSFTDLDGFAWATGYIGYAQSLGILQGVGNGLYNPAGHVTYEQFATMLVRALGWNDEALPGTWPANYIVKAKSLGIMKDISAVGSSAANRGDCAIMLFNNLNNEIGLIDKDGQWYAPSAYSTDAKADTMLSRLERVLYNLDADEDANQTYIGTTTGAGAAFVYDGTQTVADGVNIKAYLGAAVVAYANEDNEITGIKEVKSTFVSGDVSVNKSGNVILTLNDDTEYNLSGTKGMGVTATSTFAVGTFITNGEDSANPYVAATYTAIEDNSLTLAVKISGNYIKAIYSASEWTPVGLVQWTEDLAADLAEDDQLNGEDFAMTQKDKIDYESFALLGAESLEKIPVDSIVTYYENQAGEIVRIEVGTDVVTGKVAKVKDNEKYTINGNVYYLTAAIPNSDVDNDIALGDEGKFFLDYNGDIAIAEVEGSVIDSYAFVTYGVAQESGYNVSDYKVTLLTADGNETVYTLASAATAGAVYTNAASQVTTNAIVAYDLNSKGKVSVMYPIDEALTAAAINDTYADFANTATAYTSKGLLDGYRLAKDVLVYVQDDDGDWSVGTVSDIPVNDAFAANTVYYALNSDNKVQIVVLTKAAAASTDNVYGLIVDYILTQDSNDDECYELTVLIDGKEKTCLTDGKIANYNQTGLVKFGMAGDVINAVTPVTAATSAYAKGVDSTGVVIATAGSIASYETGAWTTTTATVPAGAVQETADDVVVYCDDNGDYTVSKLSAIKKDTEVLFFQCDKDDKDGIDIIVWVK